MAKQKKKKTFVKDRRGDHIWSPYPIRVAKGTRVYKKAREFQDYKMHFEDMTGYYKLPYDMEEEE